MSSSPAVEPSSPSTTPSSPALRPDSGQFHTSTPYFTGRQQQPPLNVVLPATAPATPPTYGEATLTPPPRSPGAPIASPASGDGRAHPPDGTSSDKSSETAVGGISRTTSTALSRKESYKAQRQHYRREKKRAASALLHSIEDPSVVVLADWLKVRGSLKSWTKLWCVLKPGLLLLYKSPKAKSSHWVGTVLLTSCQVIERPSKKDGFCFKLYHPLEQSIWAPRGPHNETIGAVVQPLPTAHLIFRAPSQAAGHCWLDGLELALRCSNAMLRCSRSRPEQTVAPDAPQTQTNLSHEDLEKHFNEHVLKVSELSSCSSPLMSISDYSPKRPTSVDRKVTYQVPKKPKTRKTKWAQFMESIEMLSKDHDSSDPTTPERDGGFLDFLRKKETGVLRNAPSTSSMRVVKEPKEIKITSKSLASSPYKLELKKSPILRCLELPKMPIYDKSKEKLSPTNIIEENFIKFMSTFPKRRSSIPITCSQKRVIELRESGVKTDSENDDVFVKSSRNIYKRCEVICDTPENVIIKTAPSVERVRQYSSSTSDGEYRKTPTFPQLREKFSLINYDKLPSASFEASRVARRDDRMTSHNVYVAGNIVASGDLSELAGAASDTDSEGSRPGMQEPPRDKKQDILARIEDYYVEDTNRDIGQAGELVEEVAEENKSLLWFLLKQVRPGMDLSKVVLPTFILEPRSFLDKLSDNYYHADILAQASLQEDPYQRFKTVLRWYLSGLYRKPKGLKKPYNPVLGESFRCCWKHHDSHTWTYYVAEQVSHHPPISAFYVTNRQEGFVIEGSLLARSKFYGNSTSAILEGCARVHLLNWGEQYLTTAPYAHCKGIVIGTLSMELGGKVHVSCPDTGYHAEIEFKLRSFLSSADQTNAITGRIKRGKDTIASIDGYWDGKIDIKDKKTGEESNLLDVSLLKEQRLPRFLMKIDHQLEYESQKLWLKVSEAIANDDQVAATEQKTIIEEAQRARARNLVAPWVPRFFHKDIHVIPPEGIIDQAWKYNHLNTSPWQVDEIIEYEDDFVIKALREGTAVRPALDPRRDIVRHSDSDSHDELARRSKTSTRNMKQTLYAIDSALREQTIAIERLSKTVETLSEGQRAAAALRPYNVGRIPSTSHSWDLFGGFVLAMVLQALLNWIFYQKD
ncbi:oxysterol-binding protein-related protein 8 isoform X2 [Anticarsia gemmatalis]|uniref:oxysterol-binding protein-related protein 8 isoform X2 n=1 Tax=Anticarsia gemmatalis TaxID=129554 RepID=UPI003F772663